MRNLRMEQRAGTGLLRGRSAGAQGAASSGGARSEICRERSVSAGQPWLTTVVGHPGVKFSGAVAAAGSAGGQAGTP